VDAGQVDGNDTAGHVDDVMRPSTGEGGDAEGILKQHLVGSAIILKRS